MSKKSVLITGGAGFIGSNLALKLVGQGYLVRVLDNLSPQIHGSEGDSSLYKSIKNKVDFIKGDVRKREDWIRALEGQEVVVHLAAETGTGQSMYEIERYTSVNVGGTALLLDILANSSHTVSKVVVASSRAIYGEGKYHCADHGAVYPKGRTNDDLLKGFFECTCPICGKACSALPTDEASTPSPESIYAITKLNQEQMVTLTCKSLGIPSVAFRFQNVYGPGQSLNNPYTGILAIFSNLMRENKAINIFEDGKESRDFVYIDDVVESILLGITKSGVGNKIYNVGSGRSVSVLDVANRLKQIYHSDSQIGVSGNFRAGDIRHNVANIDQVSSELGFSPKVQFNEGIEKFCAWVAQDSTVTTGDFENSILELKKRGLFK